jgi:Domain of unknown function (DUF4062)
MATQRTASPTRRQVRQKVFLSGTDYVKDALHTVCKAVKRMGFRPVWFHSSDFPSIEPNAMDNCISVAKECDRMVVVIDERAGLRHEATGKRITEAEFDAGQTCNMPCLVFVRDRVWHQSRIYHRHKKRLKNCVSSSTFKRLKLDGDQDVFEFIERLQHPSIEGRPNVPWIQSFENPDDIVKAIKGKWVMSEREEAATLDVVRNATIQEWRNERVRGFSSDKVSISPEIVRKLREFLHLALDVVLEEILAGVTRASVSGGLAVSIGNLKLLLDRPEQDDRIRVIDVEAQKP